MKFSHHAMGTIFEMFVAGQASSYAAQAAQAVFAEIDRLEGILSRFDPRSDTSQLTRLLPGQSLPVGIEVMECLTIAAEVFDSTNGAFDVTSVAQNKPEFTGFDRFHLSEKGYLSFDTRMPHQARGAQNKKIDGAPLTITIIGDPDVTPSSSGCLNLDFGGMGKGYALDKSRDILADWDIDRFLIHAGTSTVLAMGNGPENSSEEKGWAVGMAGSTIFLHDMALSGSGKEVKGEHIIDPRTGKPAAGHRSAWASCSSAALSDALSTAFIVMSPGEVGRFCQEHPGIAVRVEEPYRSFFI